MFGSIYIGLSGLNAYSRGLQQVSNNVTNMNTSGFKSSTVTFQNFYGTGDSGGLSHTVDTRGSGGGVGLGDSILDLKAGELRQTERDLDLAVDGKGFLVLLKGDEVRYARTGSFEVDKDGFIVLSGTDYRLATLDSNNHLSALSIDNNRLSAARQTEKITFSQTLAAGGNGSATVSDIKVYDKAGGEHIWTVAFTKTPPATGQTEIPGSSKWTFKVTDNRGVTIGEGALEFTGSIVLPSMRTVSVTDPNNDFSVTLDFSTLQSSQAGGNPSAAASGGYPTGTLNTITVNAKGELELAYSNEQKLALGAVALADFRDAAGLKQQSGGLFTFEGSGERIIAASSDARVGQVLGKRIEASNVDLSKQFGELILIQRGFQASSQVVSISNDMIQQLFGIRGQG